MSITLPSNARDYLHAIDTHAIVILQPATLLTLRLRENFRDQRRHAVALRLNERKRHDMR
jgi:hypothetical protein